MRKAAALGVCLCLATGSFAVAGDPAPTEFSFEFKSLPGGAIADTSVNFFPLFMDETVERIVTLELLISGLKHDSPWDLKVYLIDPRGAVRDPAFAVMLDRGDQEAVQGIDLVFSDLGSPLPPGVDGLCPGGDCSNLNYLPEDGRGMNAFSGLAGGTDAWILVIIDDSEGGSGSFVNYTLSGTAVPEPVTLSLLAVGAFVALRRRRS